MFVGQAGLENSTIAKSPARGKAGERTVKVGTTVQVTYTNSQADKEPR